MSMLKASTLSKYENSKSEEKDAGPPKEPYKQSSDESENAELGEKPFVSSLEKINKLDIPNIISEEETLNPVSALSNDSLRLEPDVEIKEHQREEYTGFTVAIRDNSAASLRLKRQDSLSTLKEVLDVPTNAEDEKLDDSRELINIFSHARVANVVHLPKDPYKDPDEVWSGIELAVFKNDQVKKYVVKSHGLARWIIDEQQAGFYASQSTESIDISYWEVDTAEIVREKGKGPYIKLNIDEEHAVYLKPRKAYDWELKKFKTDNYWPSPSTEEEVTLNSKVELSLSK